MFDEVVDQRELLNEYFAAILHEGSYLGAERSGCGARFKARSAILASLTNRGLDRSLIPGIVLLRPLIEKP